jgi:hypothetical protein
VQEIIRVAMRDHSRMAADAGRLTNSIEPARRPQVAKLHFQ